MSILTPYREAGVKSFTVQNGNAIADNPYEKYYGKECSLNLSRAWTEFNNLNLPSLPTSGIPDGPVSIEDVEEKEQFYDPPTQVWKEDHDVATSLDFGFKVRTALVKNERLMVKEEIEKLSGELDQMAFDMGIGQEVVEELNKEISDLKALRKGEEEPFTPEEQAILSKPLIFDQPEKMEQTAEGIRKLAVKIYGDNSNLYGGQRDGYVRGYTDCLAQLAQYKEKLIANVKEMGYRPGVSMCDQIIDVIENT